MKRILIMLSVSLLLFTLCPCSYGEQPQYDLPNASVPIEVLKDKFTDRDRRNEYTVTTEIKLSDDGVGIDGNGAEADGTVITVNSEGCYRLTGSLNGQLVVRANAYDKIQLVFDNAEIKSSESAAVLIECADKVFFTAAENSVNIISSSADMKGKKIDAAVYSDCDITFNGTGSLTVECDGGHGILTKDDLKICSGKYFVRAHKQGLSGKDSVRICGGGIEISSMRDGIHSEHTKSNKGFVLISGGSVDISSGKDGIYSSGKISVTDGKLNICSGADGLREDDNSSCACIRSDTAFVMYGGVVDLSSPDEAVKCPNASEILGGRIS